jgi:hypothetical protein
MGEVDIHINVNGRKTYRIKIMDRQIGNWNRDSEVISGSLIDGGVSDYIRCGGKLTPAAGTLTGERSLISKAGTEVETARL